MVIDTCGASSEGVRRRRVMKWYHNWNLQHGVHICVTSYKVSTETVVPGNKVRFQTALLVMSLKQSADRSKEGGNLMMK